MTFRKTLFWVHLIAGCVAGIIVLVMSFTGVILTYERQILAWSTRGHIRVDPPAGAQPLTAEQIVASARSQREDPTGNMTLTLRSDPREPAELRIGREGVFFVNPYSGTVVESESAGTRAFFQKVTAWHRWLGMEGEGRSTARAITGACNLAFLVLILSGAYLWLPRLWSWQALRPIMWFRSSTSGKARDFNWHNVFGLWACIPLFFVVLTALPMSYTWANDLLYRITGSEPPPPPPVKGGAKKGNGGARKGPPGRGDSARRSPAVIPTDLNNLWARATNQVPGWKSITASIAVPAGEPLSFSIDTGDGGQPQRRSTLVLNTETGAVVRTETLADASAGRRLRMWSRFVHTGEYYGLVGQTVAGVGSAAGVMLVWTGISLALRRFAAWNNRRRRRPLSPVEEPVAVEQ